MSDPCPVDAAPSNQPVSQDDPRLYTLIGVRRRGVPPQAILEFINQLGVTTSNTIIEISRFEQSVRQYLERTVPRLMLVLDPVPVVIEGADEVDGSEISIPFSPKNPAMGSHTIKFSKTVYIDRSDFREVDSKDYFRLVSFPQFFFYHQIANSPDRHPARRAASSTPPSPSSARASPRTRPRAR